MEKMVFVRCNGSYGSGYTQGKYYGAREYDEKHEKILIPNDNGGLEWVQLNTFSRPGTPQRFMESCRLKRVVYLGKNTLRLTNAKAYDVFEILDEQQHFRLIDDILQLDYYPCEKFINQEQYNEKVQAEYDERIAEEDRKTEECKIQKEASFREAERRKHEIDVIKASNTVPVPKNLVAAEYIALAFSFVLAMNPNGMMKIPFLLSLVATIATSVVYTALHIQKTRRTKTALSAYNTGEVIETKRIEVAQKNQQLFAKLRPDVLVRIAGIEAKSRILSQSEFESGVWMDTIRGIICNMLEVCMNSNGSIMPETYDDILALLSSCDDFLDAQKLLVQKSEDWVSGEMLQNAKNSIRDNMEMIDKATKETIETGKVLESFRETKIKMPAKQA